MDTTLPQVDLTTLRKLAPGDVQLWWVNDWYDGPIEAVVELEGERCLMVLVDPPNIGTSEGPCRWVLLRLTPEQHEEEERWHALFAEHVGEHWCFHTDRPHVFTSEEQERDPGKFYEPYRLRLPRDLLPNTALGWLDEMPRG
jgi:hypothetical protein